MGVLSRVRFGLVEVRGRVSSHWAPRNKFALVDDDTPTVALKPMTGRIHITVC